MTRLQMLDFAKKTALEAGKITRSYFKTSYTIEKKSDESFVTQADKESDRFIRECIEKQYPDHNILSEELGGKTTESTFRWVVDPIDGTFSFVSGIPFYSILIGLQKEEQNEFGVIYFPELDKLYVGHRGHGAFCNEEALRQTRKNTLNKALLLTSDPAFLYRTAPHFCTALLSRCDALRTWADAYAYALLAEGKADIALDYGVKIWDFVALLPILEEAGIVYSLQQTGKDSYNLIAATHQDLLHEVLALEKTAH